jgi:hypothetical protein
MLTPRGELLPVASAFTRIVASPVGLAGATREQHSPGVTARMSSQKLKVGKIEAARRQVRAAIEMWFASGDPIAIHTLVAAAHEILYDLCKRKGMNDQLFDSPAIKPSFRKRWTTMLRTYPNFFKHADRDPDDVLEFNPAINELRLLSCLMTLQSLGEKIAGPELALWVRLGLENPQILSEDIYSKGFAPDDLTALRQMTRSRFLEVHLDMQRMAATSSDTVLGDKDAHRNARRSSESDFDSGGR